MRSCQSNTMTSLYPASKYILHASHTGNTNLVLRLHELWCSLFHAISLFTSSVCYCSTKHQNIRFKCSAYILCVFLFSCVIVDIKRILHLQPAIHWSFRIIAHYHACSTGITKISCNIYSCNLAFSPRHFQVSSPLRCAGKKQLIRPPYI